MARDQVEALRAVYDEWARGNFRAGQDLWDPDVVFSLRPEFPDAAIENIRGRAEALQAVGLPE
jgi:ketosteroid isomerase-like protein